MSTTSSIDNNDNDSDGSLLTPAGDWTTTLNFLADAKQAAAPFSALFGGEKMSTSSSAGEEDSDVNARPPAYSGKGKEVPASNKRDGKKKKSPKKKKGEKIRLEVVGSAGGDGGETSGAKAVGGGVAQGDKTTGNVVLSNEQLYVVKMLFKANKERYGDGALTEERLMEMMGQTAQISLTPALADPPPDSPVSPEGPLLSAHHVPTEEEIYDNALRHLGLEPETFDRSGEPKVDLRHATAAQLIVEGERAKTLGKIEGLVAGTLAVISENKKVDEAYKRANARFLEEKRAEGMREGWTEAMLGRQKEWEELSEEERSAEERKKAIADAQLRLENGNQLRANARAAWEKVKGSGKKFLKAYGKDALKIAFVFGLKETLDDTGVQEPERVMKEVLGLGMAMNAVGLSGQDGGDGAAQSQAN